RIYEDAYMAYRLHFQHNTSGQVKSKGGDSSHTEVDDRLSDSMRNQCLKVDGRSCPEQFRVLKKYSALPNSPVQNITELTDISHEPALLFRGSYSGSEQAFRLSYFAMTIPTRHEVVLDAAYSENSLGVLAKAPRFSVYDHQRMIFINTITAATEICI